MIRCFSLELPIFSNHIIYVFLSSNKCTEVEIHFMLEVDLFVIFRLLKKEEKSRLYILTYSRKKSKAYPKINLYLKLFF